MNNLKNNSSVSQKYFHRQKYKIIEDVGALG